MRRPFLGDPPDDLRDPYMRRLNLPWNEWKRAVRGWIGEPHHIAAALTLAGYANKDGGNAHPGVERLADDLCRGPRAVRYTLAALEEAGFITRASRGGRQGIPKGHANAYQLTIPAPLAAALGLWEDQRNGPQWMERPSDAPRSRTTTGTPGARGRALQGLPTTGTFDATTGTPSAPHLVSNTSPLTPFRSLESGVTSAKRRADEEHEDERHDEEQERSNEEEPDDYDWIVDQLYGVESHEETTVDEMLSRGAHPKAIVNAIRAQRSDVTS